MQYVIEMFPLAYHLKYEYNQFKEFLVSKLLPLLCTSVLGLFSTEYGMAIMSAISSLFLSLTGIIS